MPTIAEKAQALCDRLSCHEIYPDEVSALNCEWETDPRWSGIVRRSAQRRY
jgi:isocitrate lyase